MTIAANPALSETPETVWFGGTQRALPYNLAELKEDGLTSTWLRNNHDQTFWELNLGTDVSVWQRTTTNTFMSIGARFGVKGRFQMNSSSFDLWAVDFRGGGVLGMRRERMAYEAFLYHESSHLGDEVLDAGERQRFDYSVNGIRVMASRQWNDHLRTYAGFLGQPDASVDRLRSVGIQAGAELKHLPPWDRGFAAVNAEFWSWRNWAPDVTARLGVFLYKGKEESRRFDASCFVELRSGRVDLGQYYNETESYLGGGLGASW